MRIAGNQRNIYLLAMGLLLIAAVLACMWTFGGTETASDAVTTPAPAESEAPLEEIAEETALPSEDVSEANAAQDANTISTVVYYQDNYGYLVPVMCRIPQQEGVAKATLSMMVKSSENDMSAARLGLRTILPENTTIDLDISNGLARVDLGKQVLDMPDAAAETGMISAVVQALTEFDTVNRVEFLIDGQKREKLTHGTDVSGTFERGDINLETVAPTSANVKPVTLYFPCESASVVVPVTRMVYSKPDVNTAVLELAKGPSTVSPLEGALPKGCGLIGVTVENGIAKVNFTKEFADMIDNADGGRLALKALVLTCTQFDGIDGVEIYVEGEKYDPGENTLNVPTFANVAGEIVNTYIQTQSDMIFQD